ncbi:MAG: alpha-galactosidase [Anaerolineaceae bacterium]|nr:alpha-galactosidase [Anaerolineaceae bacterium]
MAVLENGLFKVINNQRTGSFSIYSQLDRFPALVNNKLAVSGRRSSKKKFFFEINLHKSVIPESPRLPESKMLQYFGKNEGLKIGWKVEFMLGEEQPIVLWRLEINNLSEEPIFLEKIFLLKPLDKITANIRINKRENGQGLSFFSNGWQSWSYSGAYRGDQCMQRSRLGFLQKPMVINPGTPTFQRKGFFSSDFFGVVGDPRSNKGFLLGFLSQKQHFGTVAVNLGKTPQIQMWANGDNARLQPKAVIKTDWAVYSICNIDDPQPLFPYLIAVAKEHKIGELSSPQAGWCSWYRYYQDISQEILKKNIDVLYDIRKDFPINLIQIDDGYQKEVGDWFDFNKKFPDGVKPLAKRIENDGFTPGIWLAPFIVHPRSQLARNHPEWLLVKKNGQFTRAGFVWNVLGKALDLTAPGALDFVFKVVDVAVHDWGFKYLKLDFLYAAALQGKFYDDTKTRAQVLRTGMETIRHAAGRETTLLGCGAPLGSMLGLVDILRIGADVSGHWKPAYFNVGFPFKKEPHMPSAENSIHNTITRSFLHNKWWVNDPDCLLLGDESSLSLEEVQTLATVIALTGGSVLLSDNMETLSENRLKIAKVLIPPMNQQARVIDWMAPGTPSRLRVDLHGAVGTWHLVSFSNWKDQPLNISLGCEAFGLKKDEFIISSFWDSTSWRVGEGEYLFSGTVLPHATVLLAIRSLKKNECFYIGSDLHISQGLEIEKCSFGKRELNLQFSQGKVLTGYIELSLPDVPQSAIYQGKGIEWIRISENGYRFFIEGENPGILSVMY